MERYELRQFLQKQKELANKIKNNIKTLLLAIDNEEEDEEMTGRITAERPLEKRDERDEKDFIDFITRLLIDDFGLQLSYDQEQNIKYKVKEFLK